MSFVRARKTARHAKPSTAAPTLVAAGLTASFAAVDVAAMATAASASASDGDLAKLRACESGGNYATNTGNGYFGAYQFALPTWRSLGYSGRPDQASPATQDAAVRQLQARSGWGQWPACSRRYGLGSGGSSSSADSVTVPDRSDSVRASRSRSRFPTVSHRTAAVRHAAVRPAAPRVRVVVAPTTPPPFLHKQLSVADGDQYRVGVHMWQDRMAKRGWPVRVDGYFGPQSAAVAKAFAAQKGIHLTALPGEVDKGVWDAAWRLPVS